jgi:hypothetical protein
MRAFVHPSVQSANRIAYDKRKPFLTSKQSFNVKKENTKSTRRLFGGVFHCRPETHVVQPSGKTPKHLNYRKERKISSDSWMGSEELNFVFIF